MANFRYLFPKNRSKREIKVAKMMRRFVKNLM